METFQVEAGVGNAETDQDMGLLKSTRKMCITWLFAYCKGGNFNIRSAITSAKEGKSGFFL